MTKQQFRMFLNTIYDDIMERKHTDCKFIKYDGSEEITDVGYAIEGINIFMDEVVRKMNDLPDDDHKYNIKDIVVFRLNDTRYTGSGNEQIITTHHCIGIITDIFVVDTSNKSVKDGILYEIEFADPYNGNLGKISIYEEDIFQAIQIV